MKLRRLRIERFRGLREVEVALPEPTIDYDDVDIRFFVGRNGSGKSTALEAIALIFSHLEAGISPDFEFELEYSLRGTDVLLRAVADGVEPHAIEAFRREPGGVLRPIDYASSNVLLMPDRIVGYSTGPTSGMREALVDAVEQRQAQIAIDDADTETESEIAEDARRDREIFLDSRQTLFFGSADATLPVLASLASPVGDHFADKVLATVSLRRDRPLLAFSLDLAENWDARLPLDQLDAFQRLLETAANVSDYVDESGATVLLAAFDVDETLHERLRPMLGSGLSFLERLVEWQRRGVLLDVRLVLSKEGVAEPITDADLSDGELFYVSRYALLHLLGRTSESLLLLDEPETHFNDRWKVDLVDNICDALGASTPVSRCSHQVIIATHSDLTITDADPALVRLFWVAEDGRIEVSEPPASTFGAAPGDLGHLLFGLESPIGNFANRLLREALDQDDLEQLRTLNRVMGPGYLRLALQSRILDLEGEAP